MHYLPQVHPYSVLESKIILKETSLSAEQYTIFKTRYLSQNTRALAIVTRTTETGKQSKFIARKRSILFTSPSRAFGALTETEEQQPPWNDLKHPETQQLGPDGYRFIINPLPSELFANKGRLKRTQMHTHTHSWCKYFTLVEGEDARKSGWCEYGPPLRALRRIVGCISMMIHRLPY